MESLVSFIPLVLIVIVIVVIVRWRRSVNDLKNPAGEAPKRSQSSGGQPARKTTAATYKPSVSVRSITVGDKEIDLNVKQEELDRLIQKWSFIWEDEKPKPLTGKQAWYKQRNQNKFLKEEPARALDWVLPFVPKQVAEHEQVRPHVEGGLTYGVGSLVKTLRALVKESRKANRPHRDLLEGLYGSLVIDDLYRSLADVHLGATEPIGFFTALSDLKARPVDYRQIGYEHLEAGLKTDRKWFVEEFGEPDQHISVKEYYSDAWRADVSRRCWKALQESWGLKGSDEEKKANIQAWLREQLRSEIVMARAWGEDDRQRQARREAKLAEAAKRASGPPPGFKSMSFYSEKVVGVSFENPDGTSRQKLISKMSEGEAIQLVRDPDNPKDRNAIKVLNKDSRQVGFIDKFRVQELAPQMDSGYEVEAWVESITGGETGESLGLVIGVQRYKPLT